ncbi:MAG: isoleucine--tRNA ligase, partial [Deltaproteobacteria bacterium]|nr:isoleucine--tRNA ligase [Deltaproteobacteria bacterium]
PVDDNGKFTKDVPEFEGQYVFKANEGIIELLKSKDALLLREDIRHSYPHCWRCKSPIIFRATEQWFASMDKTGLRKDALTAIDNAIRWIPSWGRDRIYNMIENRPDWCLSRQRAWGVPIPGLKCKTCSHAFLDKNLIDKLVAAFEKEGADIWFEQGLKDLLPNGVKCPKCGATDFDKEQDILDVWFDSGVSFAAVLEKRANLKFPADLYLEGSDQHRGWFHSSLLASIGTRGTPPYKAVLTHGFVVDGSGKKMSKSTGNVIAPQEVIKKYGAEVLRLWVCAEDYREDIRISEEILTRLAEAYRRIRNTFRYILGNLYDFDPSKDVVPYAELAEIDRLTLHRLCRLDETVQAAYKEFEFHKIYHAAHNFCAVDLSAYYLDIIKDRLYTNKATSKARRAGQTTIYHVLDHLVRLLAPILVFTTDEAWGFMPGKREPSVHLAAMPEANKVWLDDKLEEKWNRLLKIKDEISKTLEGARRDKFIGHPLDAEVSINLAHKDILKDLFQEADTQKMIDLLNAEKSPLGDILIISKLNVIDNKSEMIIQVKKAEGAKCERCWHYDPTVGANPTHPTVCSRCAEALK